MYYHLYKRKLVANVDFLNILLFHTIMRKKIKEKRGAINFLLSRCSALCDMFQLQPSTMTSRSNFTVDRHKPHLFTSPYITFPTTWKGAKIINCGILSVREPEALAFVQVLEARIPLSQS
jgi:hypothetical protein